MSASDLAVMVNGVPGRMATAVAEEVLNRGLILAEEALTGPDMATESIRVGESTVRLYKPTDHAECLKRMKAKYERLIAVDYTTPTAANINVASYCASGVSFVLGTTGGDEKRMNMDIDIASSKGGDVYAVIAPNMGKQIVAFQAMMKLMSEEFPGCFTGYKLKVTESHQSTKLDTSGTAKAVIKSFNSLGVDKFDVGQVRKVRTAHESMQDMKVPAKFVTAGHAFHTYRVESREGDVAFEFQHNVCGRQLYAAGTVDAVVFLDRKKREQGVNDKEKKVVFNMIDILRGGNMS